VGGCTCPAVASGDSTGAPMDVDPVARVGLEIASGAAIAHYRFGRCHRGSCSCFQRRHVWTFHAAPCQTSQHGRHPSEHTGQHAGQLRSWHRPTAGPFQRSQTRPHYQVSDAVHYVAGSTPLFTPLGGRSTPRLQTEETRVRHGALYGRCAGGTLLERRVQHHVGTWPGAPRRLQETGQRAARFQ
jgi:hypothetical protein